MVYHIVFKLDANDFFSQGKNYEVDQCKDEADTLMQALHNWSKEYDKDKYPNRQFMVMYPVNN